MISLDWQKPAHEGSPQGVGSTKAPMDPLAAGLLAFMATGVLAMVGTWFLVQLPMVPADEGTSMGLLVVLFVLLFGGFVIYRLVAPEFREGRYRKAFFQLACLTLLLLLAACLAVALPWGLAWLISRSPWIGSALQGLFWLAMSANLIQFFWKSWRTRSRKSA